MREIARDFFIFSLRKIIPSVVRGAAPITALLLFRSKIVEAPAAEAAGARTVEKTAWLASIAEGRIGVKGNRQSSLRVQSPAAATTADGCGRCYVNALRLLLLRCGACRTPYLSWRSFPPPRQTAPWRSPGSSIQGGVAHLAPFMKSYSGMVGSLESSVKVLVSGCTDKIPVA